MLTLTIGADLDEMSYFFGIASVFHCLPKYGLEEICL